MEKKELDTLFLGRGWSFPTTFVKSKREVTMVSGEEDIKQSLEILLGTTLGERIMNADFGCNLKDYLFQPISTTIKAIVKDIVKTAIVKHEARIDLLSIELNTEQELEGVLLLEVNYTVRATNSRSNYVYPFYLEEGTNT
ncbi:MAG: GPW/gp25 family protein [Bacteroidetes bacterium]|nr:GPW/gp25 family protein [Bacteroidota bacterium]